MKNFDILVKGNMIFQRKQRINVGGIICKLYKILIFVNHVIIGLNFCICQLLEEVSEAYIKKIRKFQESHDRKEKSKDM